jgi:hypothetical protein
MSTTTANEDPHFTTEVDEAALFDALCGVLQPIPAFGPTLPTPEPKKTALTPFYRRCERKCSKESLRKIWAECQKKSSEMI